MKVNDIKIKKRFRKDIGDLEPLKKSISEIGLMHPIVANEDDELIAGERRLKAVKELGWDDVPITKINLKEIVRGEFDENNVRKDFTISEKVAIWEAMENYEWGKSRSDSERKIERASKILGISHDSLSKAKQIIDSDKEELIEQMDKSGSINAIYRKIKFAKQKKEIETLKPNFNGKYDVIVIDCPWDSKIGILNDKGARGVVDYPTMNLEELKKIKLPMKDNCAVWVWFTNYKIADVIELIDDWGLDKKTVLTWDKQNMGVGHFLRNITEHCILCFKGKPYFNNTKWTTLISEKRTTHSTKPEIFYKMVNEICAGRKLDYFARKKREGWDVYGDEVK